MNERHKKFVDFLVDQNTIPVLDRINEELLEIFKHAYSAILMKKAENITVAISSGGGNVQVCMEMFDMIKTFPGHTQGLVIGKGMSSAAILLQACEKRLATANSRILIHHGTSDFPNAFLFDDKKLQDFLSRRRKTEERIAKIISARCGKSIEEVLALTAEDRPLDTDEAISFGLLDGIWDKPLPFKFS